MSPALHTLPVVCVHVPHTLPVVCVHVPHTLPVVCVHVLHTLPVVCKAEGWIHLFSAASFIVQSGLSRVDLSQTKMMMKRRTLQSMEINPEFLQAVNGTKLQLLHILHTSLLFPGNKFIYYSLFIQFQNIKL